MRYLSFAQKLCQTYLVKREYEIINLIIGVVFNISNQMENDNRVTIRKLDEQQVIEFLLNVGRECVLNGPVTECFLQTLENFLGYEFIFEHSVNK